MSERICEAEGCTNLGRLRTRRGKRDPLCNTHTRERWPSSREAHRKDLRENAPKRNARRLLSGVRIRSLRGHHRAVRHILGGEVGDGLTVSRTCQDDCPDSWLGWHWTRGTKSPYRLCIPAHYVLEGMAANLARKKAAQ